MLDLARDAIRFIMYFKRGIEKSPDQAYISGLVFSPARSLIRRLFKEEGPKWIATKPAVEDNWNACLQTLEGHSGDVKSVVFSRDASRLASASLDETVKIWDASSGECLQTLESHSSYVNSVVFSRDASRLASASWNKTVKIWDASSGEGLQTLEIGKTLQTTSFDHTGSYLRTNIGVIALGASSSSDISSVADPRIPRYQGWALSANGE